MARRTIELLMGGVKARAVMFDKEMPKTCDAIWEILPLREMAVHGIWVGREVFLPMEGDQYLKLEQEWRPPLFVLPGDICYAYRQPHLSRGKTSGRDELAEIAVYYGRDCRLWNVRGGPIIRGQMKGIETHGYRMLFARIDHNLKEFERVANRCRREGYKELIIQKGNMVDIL